MPKARRYFDALIAFFWKKGFHGRGGGQHQLPARPSRDDVFYAFRLILGREPEDESVVHSHMQVGSVAELRRLLLNSEEFRGKYRAMHPDVDNDPYWNVRRRTVVFVHLQKTGGTSLREIVGSNFAPDRRCPIFENKLHVLSLAELAHYDFFAGHFDIASLRFIPRDEVSTICMFREPRARLISLYRFLRSHPVGDEFASDKLIQLSHRYSAQDFFSRPEIRLYSAVNNHYTVALGRSFLWFDQNRENLASTLMVPVLLDAKLQIQAMTALGITERFAQSVKLISHALDIPEPPVIEKKHATDQFATFDTRFRRVEPVELTASLMAAMEDLIIYDLELYMFALSEFDRRLQREVSGDPNLRMTD